MIKDEQSLANAVNGIVKDSADSSLEQAKEWMVELSCNSYIDSEERREMINYLHGHFSDKFRHYGTTIDLEKYLEDLDKFTVSAWKNIG